MAEEDKKGRTMNFRTLIITGALSLTAMGTPALADGQGPSGKFGPSGPLLSNINRIAAYEAYMLRKDLLGNRTYSTNHHNDTHNYEQVDYHGISTSSTCFACADIVNESGDVNVSGDTTGASGETGAAINGNIDF